MAGTRRRLDRRQVVLTAVQLLDEEGLDGLSTRRLAARLGVRSPALYWHVSNKDELLNLVAEEIGAEVAEPDPTLDWRDRLAAGMWELRRVLLAHRDASRLLAITSGTGASRLRGAESTVSTLLAAGFDEAETAVLSLLLFNYVLGLVDLGKSGARAAPPPIDPELHPGLRRVAGHFGAADRDTVFRTGVELLLNGLEQRLSSR